MGELIVCSCAVRVTSVFADSAVFSCAVDDSDGGKHNEDGADAAVVPAESAAAAATAAADDDDDGDSGDGCKSKSFKPLTIMSG